MYDQNSGTTPPHLPPPKELKALRRWVKLFLAIGIIGGLLGIVHNVHVRFNPGVERHYGHVFHVHIGGRDFAVPDEYIRGPRPTEANAKQLYIWLTLPDYVPYRGDYVEGKNPVHIGYRFVSVLIDDTGFTTDLAFRYNAYRNRKYLIPKASTDTYGLHKDLIYVQRPQDSQPAHLNDFYYAQASDGKVNAFINCRRDEPSPRNPICQIFFQDGRLIYQVSISKVHLYEWREIETHVHDLVESFSCVSSTKTQSSTPSSGAKPCPP